MTFRFGNGWVTFERSIVAATGNTALETKARAKVQRECITTAQSVPVVTVEEGSEIGCQEVTQGSTQSSRT